MMTRNIPVVSVVFVAETQSHVGLIRNKVYSFANQ